MKGSLLPSKYELPTNVPSQAASLRVNTAAPESPLVSTSDGPIIQQFFQFMASAWTCSNAPCNTAACETEPLIAPCTTTGSGPRNRSSTRLTAGLQKNVRGRWRTTAASQPKALPLGTT